jgi:hypothetical protein
MGLRIAPQMLGTLVVVALGVTPGIGFSQAERAPDPAQRIFEAIEAAQAQEGPRSPALIQLLSELGTLYEAEGEHALATAALAEARHVVRATYGLHTLEQVPLIQQAVANQRALGNFAMVQALEEELLDLAERHPNDMRTVAIHRDAGARRVDVLRRFLAGETPGEVYPEAGLFSFYRGDVIRQLASDAQIHFAGAAAVVLRNGLYSSDELRELETEIVRAGDVVRQRSRSSIRSAPPAAPSMENTFSTASNNRLYRIDGDHAFYNPELVQRTSALSDLAARGGLQDAPAALKGAATPAAVGHGMTSGYRIGRDSYQRLIAYDEAAYGSSAGEAALRSRLEAYLRLADWELLYSQNGAAFDQYAQVHELLTTADFGEPLIADIFSPPIPTVLPTFLPNPLETTPSARYIEASFEVTKYGESRRVEIVGAAPDVSDAAKEDLVSLIKASRFRPRVTDGKLGRVAPVVVRYYLNE